MPTLRRIALAALGLFVAHGELLAKDHFLTIAGGYSPKGNQISLEKNVKFFRQVLASERPDNPEHDVYFADGNDVHRDLQYIDTDFDCPPARRIVMELFGNVDKIGYRYRNHEVPDIRSETSPQLVKSRLRQIGRGLRAGDRLFVYATAHGGSSMNKKNPHDTRLYTWNTRSIKQTEFAEWLDEISPDITVTLVMVQCYSGGFSHTIFKKGDHEQGLADQLRCGFFSQRHDRVAAGCTPDANEADYQEYSTFFWSALAGYDRLGHPVGPIDYDGDGHTSLAEAHAYAVIESETVDIPLRSSDAFLEEYSKIGIDKDVPPPADSGGTDEPMRLPATELLEMKGNLGEMIELATPVDRQIAISVAEELELKLTGEVAQVDAAMSEARNRLRDAERRGGRAQSAYRRAQRRVVSDVKKEWPELEEDHSPTLAALMDERADEFVSKIESMSNYHAFKKSAKARTEARESLMEAKRYDALVRRMKQIVRRIVLEANLPDVAAPTIVDRYQKLLELESQTLDPTSVPQKPVADGTPVPSPVNIEKMDAGEPETPVVP